MRDPLHSPSSLPQGQHPGGVARGLWLLIVVAIGAGTALPGIITDVHTAARIAMIVAGGAILGGLMGWLLEEMVPLHLFVAPAAPQAPESLEELEIIPIPSLWPIVLAIGVAIALPGFVAEFSQGLRIALVAVGTTIGGISLLAWFMEDRLTLFLGHVRKAISPGPLRPYQPSIQALRSEARQALHLKALQEIARLRFDFPNPKYPHLKTHLNQPQPSIGVQMPDGSVAYPDIVVVQHPENYTEIVAQVETSETVNEATARYLWLPYADLAPLYLYVPVGKGDEALALCRRFRIPLVGIRTWRYVVGYDEMEINDHYTALSGPEDLLPRILRRG